MEKIFTVLGDVICPAIAILFTVTAVEFSKALASTLLGDKLPKNEGRLTLNPFKHFEPIGFVLLWAYKFGWGKPVRTSSMFYKNRKRDTIIVYLTPIIVCLVMGALFYILYALLANKLIMMQFKIGNSLLGLLLGYLAQLVAYITRYFIILAVCNIIPIVPFSGERILSALLPVEKTMSFNQMQNILQVIMLLALFFRILPPIILGIANAVLSFFSAIFFFV